MCVTPNSNPEFQDIIAWLPHGRSWRILQHKAFEERVIPLYFRHGRYSRYVSESFIPVGSIGSSTNQRDILALFDLH
jgi:HSF-type DNA-binding